MTKYILNLKRAFTIRVQILKITQFYITIFLNGNYCEDNISKTQIVLLKESVMHGSQNSILPGMS